MPRTAAGSAFPWANCYDDSGTDRKTANGVGRRLSVVFDRYADERDADGTCYVVGILYRTALDKTGSWTDMCDIGGYSARTDRKKGKWTDMDIIIRDLVKCYGKKCVLNKVNLEIKGGMFGLLGANGSGKTTLMRILATLLPKNSGNVILDGIPVEERRKIRELVGYLPQDFNMYPYYTVYQALDYIAYLSGMKEGRAHRIGEILEWVNLKGVRKLKIRELSGGMKRRLGIGMALVHEPKLLIADEPTVGLDPEERIRFRNLLRSFAENRTVLLSTHIAGDVEASCDHLAILSEGKVLFGGSMGEFLKSASGSIWEIRGNRGEVECQLAKYPKACLISQTMEEMDTVIRVYSEEKPGEMARETAPRAEDAYIGISRR